jgi:hypothetical protein
MLRWPNRNKYSAGPSAVANGVQKRNAFAACAAFRIEGLEASLNHAREIAVREELDVGREARPARKG